MRSRAPFAFWLTRRVHAHDLAGYVGAQVLGALIGAGIFRLAWGAAAAEVGYGATLPGAGVGIPTAAAIEGGMTAALVLTIFGFVSSPRMARWTPAAVWLLVATLVWQVAPLTGTSLNPARSLGPAAVAGETRHLWLYLVAPMTGALAAAALWRLVPARILTAKLFHDRHYPSVMRTELPAMPPPRRS
jgi:aquaporin Z